MHPVVALFCGKSKERILRDGGSQSWRLVPSHAAQHEYLVCCRSGVDWVEGSEERGSAFLIGRIAGIAPSNEVADRYLIKISEYAEVAIPGVWKGWRNPVKYTTLEELGIDISNTKFRPLPAAPSPEPPRQAQGVAVAPADPLRLSIGEAKPALARYYGVEPAAIEIVIRG